MRSVNSYCDNNGLTLHIYLPLLSQSQQILHIDLTVIVTITVNTAYIPPVIVTIALSTTYIPPHDSYGDNNGEVYMQC
jgi:hypothetical protein